MALKDQARTTDTAGRDEREVSLLPPPPASEPPPWAALWPDSMEEAVNGI